MITLVNATVDTIMEGLLHGMGCDNCGGVMTKDEAESSDNIAIVICSSCKKKVRFDLKEYPRSVIGVILDEGAAFNESDKSEE